MGLDMYAFEAKKPTEYDSNVVYRISVLTGCVTIPEAKRNDAKYQQLIHLAAPLTAMTEYYDIEKIRKEFCLSDNSYIVEIRFDRIVVYDRELDKNFEISMSRVEEEFMLEKNERYLVVDLKENAYWRKAYDVQDWIHKQLNCVVENCGYYRLTKDVVDRYNDIFGGRGYNPEISWPEDDDVELYYHEWY